MDRMRTIPLIRVSLLLLPAIHGTSSEQCAWFGIGTFGGGIDLCTENEVSSWNAGLCRVGHLVIIDSDFMMNSLLEFIKDKELERAWIGLSKDVEHWKWINEEYLNSFSYWRKGMPEIYGGNCAFVSPSTSYSISSLANLDCNTPLDYVCQSETSDTLPDIFALLLPTTEEKVTTLIGESSTEDDPSPSPDPGTTKRPSTFAQSSTDVDTRSESEPMITSTDNPISNELTTIDVQPTIVTDGHSISLTITDFDHTPSLRYSDKSASEMPIAFGDTGSRETVYELIAEPLTINSTNTIEAATMSTEDDCLIACSHQPHCTVVTVSRKANGQYACNPDTGGHVWHRVNTNVDT
ncbi:hypothetical protein CAPTEDRAFT_192290 [Capitella teleta]|uniref:C-type lectin domain-containing protein n=1 Tax=Capitella teleta TaxID=283909 RepID=R7UAE7_CAPTE|nr:hypothetical protein CAPTEDRAFT_192290 [Capitella teleta]|eukprot:ELU03101.1 hypothetical protein CAPTEDRAFT_192290 [Capitella teleta]